jgi:hypothetical protein
MITESLEESLALSKKILDDAYDSYKKAVNSRNLADINKKKQILLDALTIQEKILSMLIEWE